MSARVTIEQLESFCVEALKACDVGEENARATAQLLAFTDSWGVFTHGSKLLIGYAKRLTGKGLKGNGTPSVVREGPSWALVDGDSTESNDLRTMKSHSQNTICTCLCN